VELWKKEDPEFWNAFLEGVRPLPARREPRWDDALPLLGAEAKRISRTMVLQPTNLLAAEAFLEEHKEYSKNVRQALRKPKFRFPVDFTDGFGTLLPHLAQIKREAQSFHIEALLASEGKDVEGAIAAVENISRTGSAVAAEPMLISQLVRIACYNMALEASERLLSRHVLSNAQLDKLNATVDELAMPGALRLSFVSERAMFLSVFLLSPSAAAQLGSPSGDEAEEMSESTYQAGTGFLGFLGLNDADRRLMLETMEKAIWLSDRDDAKALKDCEALFVEAASTAKRLPPKIFCAILMPAEEKAAIRFARLEARRRAAMVAIAVERYRLANGGSTPEDLDELIPQFLRSIPSDPFDGQPLRYKELPTGFVVYSIGPDRTDDGGIEPRQKGGQKNFDVTFVVER